MKNQRKIKSILLPVVLVFMLAICGGCTSGSSSGRSAAAESSSAGNANAQDYAAGEAVYDMKETSAGENIQETSGNAEPAIEAAESNQKLIYTCDMEIQTLTFTETAQKIRDAIRQYNGIIEYESASDSDRSWYEDSTKERGTLFSNLVIRIPVENYEDFLKDLEGAGGRITDRSMSVQNITQVYNDQTVYIQSLETQETRLMQMMEQAQTIDEMIAVEARLTEVQTELNQARSRLAGMDTDVAYSTVNLSLQEVVRYTDTVTKKTFPERIRIIFSDSLDDFRRTMEALLTCIIYLLPYAVLAGIIVPVVLFATRKKRAENRQRKEEAMRQMQAQRPYGFPGGGQMNGTRAQCQQGHRPNGTQAQNPQGTQPNGAQQRPAGEHGESATSADD